MWKYADFCLFLQWNANCASNLNIIHFKEYQKSLILTSSQHLHQQVPYLGHSLKARNDIYSCWQKHMLERQCLQKSENTNSKCILTFSKTSNIQWSSVLNIFNFYLSSFLCPSWTLCLSLPVVCCPQSRRWCLFSLQQHILLPVLAWSLMWLETKLMVSFFFYISTSLFY